MGGPHDKKSEKDKKKRTRSNQSKSGETPDDKKLNRCLSDSYDEADNSLLDKVGEKLRTLREKEDKLT